MSRSPDLRSVLPCAWTLALLSACSSPTTGSDAGMDGAIDATGDGPVAVDVAPDVAAWPITPRFDVRFDTGGRLRVEVDGVFTAALEPIARFADGSERSLAGVADGTVGADDYRRVAPDGLAFEAHVVRDAGGAAADVRWTLSSPMPLQGVTWRTDDAAFTPDGVLVNDGMQSWSFAGATPIGPVPGAAWPTSLGNVVEDRPGASWFRADLLARGTGVSLCGQLDTSRSWVVDVGRPRSDAPLHLALVDGVFADETRTLAEGRALLSGGFSVTRANGSDAFACSARQRPVRARTPRAFPRAWWTWNTLFANVDAARIRAQLPVLRTLDPSNRMLVVDDGWERAWGDWTERDGFGVTLAALATELQGQGLSLGLWLAPFLVQQGLPLTTQHADWFLRTAAGMPSLERLPDGRVMQILDPTHPDVRTHLTALFADLRRRGITLFKIDFLYLAARPGVRHDPNVNGIRAYQLGLEAIATGAGDAWIDGCGALVLHGAPYFDGVRIGADATFANVQPFYGSAIAVGRNLSVRAGLAAWGVVPDPDQAVARDLALEPARSFLAVTALSGAFGYGDDLSVLASDRRAWLAEPWFVLLRDHLRGVARPVDLAGAARGAHLVSPGLDGFGTRRTRPVARMPDVWTAQLDDGRPVAVLFNLEPDTREVSVWPAAFPPAAAGTATELVTGTAVACGLESGCRVSVPGQGVRLLTSAR